MSTITLEVPDTIAKKYKGKVIDYKVFLSNFENDKWEDTKLDRVMEAGEFYDYLDKEL